MLEGFTLSALLRTISPKLHPSRFSGSIPPYPKQLARTSSSSNITSPPNFPRHRSNCTTTLLSTHNTSQSSKMAPANLPAIFNPTQQDIEMMLAAQCHLGAKNLQVHMEPYLWKRRPDGVNVLNIGKTWEKIVMAARIIVAIDNPADSTFSFLISGRSGTFKLPLEHAILGYWI